MAVIADSLDYCPTLPDPAASMRYEVGTENSELQESMSETANDKKSGREWKSSLLLQQS